MRCKPATVLIALSLALAACDANGLFLVVQPTSSQQPSAAQTSSPSIAPTVSPTPVSSPSPNPTVDLNLHPAYSVASELAPLANQMAQAGVQLGESSKTLPLLSQSAPSFGTLGIRSTHEGFPFDFLGQGVWNLKNDNGVAKFNVELNFYRTSDDSLILEDLFAMKNYVDLSTLPPKVGPLNDLLRPDQRGVDFSKLKMSVTDHFDPFMCEGVHIELRDPTTGLIPFTPNGPETLTFTSNHGAFTLPDGSSYSLNNLKYVITDILDGGAASDGTHDFSLSKCEGSFDFRVPRKEGVFTGKASNDKAGPVEITFFRDGVFQGKAMRENGELVYRDAEGKKIGNILSMP